MNAKIFLQDEYGNADNFDSRDLLDGLNAKQTTILIKLMDKFAAKLSERQIPTNDKKEADSKALNIAVVIARFFKIMFKLMTFTIKSEYDRWFEVSGGLLVWLNMFVIVYAVLSILNVL